MPVRQRLLQFEPYRNSALFSSHWLASRLRLEPEWTDYRADAEAALTQLTLPSCERQGVSAGGPRVEGRSGARRGGPASTAIWGGARDRLRHAAAPAAGGARGG